MTPQQKIDQRDMLTLAHHDYEKSLVSHALFKLNNNAASQDLVQDTFMKTWNYMVSGGKIDIMKAFLYHILNNLIVDEYRKHTTASLDALIDKGFEPSVDDSTNLFDVFDGKIPLLLIQHLPEKYRSVMHMRYKQELSLKEMSLITGQSRNTIAVQIHRGLGKLKLLYNPT